MASSLWDDPIAPEFSSSDVFQSISILLQNISVHF